MAENTIRPDIYQLVPFCELPGVVQSVESIVTAINTHPNYYGQDPHMRIVTTWDGTIETVHSRSITNTLALLARDGPIDNRGKPVHPQAGINIEPGSKIRTWVQAPQDPGAKQHLAQGLEKLASKMALGKRKCNDVVLNSLRRLLIDTGVWRYDCDPVQFEETVTNLLAVHYGLPNGDRE